MNEENHSNWPFRRTHRGREAAATPHPNNHDLKELEKLRSELEE